MKRTIRMHVGSDATVFDGQDEGGKYIDKEVEISDKLIKKAEKYCGGCHDSFYNHRCNCGGTMCWSLEEAKASGGKLRCYH